MITPLKNMPTNSMAISVGTCQPFQWLAGIDFVILERREKRFPFRRVAGQLFRTAREALDNLGVGRDCDNQIVGTRLGCPCSDAWIDVSDLTIVALVIHGHGHIALRPRRSDAHSDRLDAQGVKHGLLRKLAIGTACLGHGILNNKLDAGAGIARAGTRIMIKGENAVLIKIGPIQEATLMRQEEARRQQRVAFISRKAGVLHIGGDGLVEIDQPPCCEGQHCFCSDCLGDRSCIEGRVAGHRDVWALLAVIAFPNRLAVFDDGNAHAGDAVLFDQPWHDRVEGRGEFRLLRTPR